MAKARNPWIGLRAATPAAAAVLIVAFFAGYAVFGDNGLLAWKDYSRRLEVKQAELKQVERQQAVLANRVALLDPRHADPDMVDELVRRNLGVAHPDEVIVPLD